MNDFILLICGFGRCGTSLMMQMLEAGGYPISGEYPAFEDFVSQPGKSDPSTWPRYVGRAVKVLDPQIAPLPTGIPLRAIWLDRNHIQQSNSQAKLARQWMGLEFGRAGRRKLIASYKRDLPLALSALRAVNALVIARLSFEDLIRAPWQSALTINDAVGGDLDITAMAAVAIPRETDCLPFMLEEALVLRHVDERRARAS